MIKEKSDRFASTSSATSSTTDSVATVSITPPPITSSSSSPTTPIGTTGTVTSIQSTPDGVLNSSSALSKSPNTTSTGGSGQSPQATKTTTNNNSSNATGINTTNSSTVPKTTASGVSPQSSSSSSSSHSNTNHSPTHQLPNKETDGQSSITPTGSSLMPTIKDEPVSSDSPMGNGEDMCALQADQIKRESDSGSSTTTQSSTTLPTAGSLKDSSGINSRLGKNGVGAANSGIIGSTNTGSVAGGYEKGNRSPLSEGGCYCIICIISIHDEVINKHYGFFCSNVFNFSYKVIVI